MLNIIHNSTSKKKTSFMVLVTNEVTAVYLDSELLKGGTIESGNFKKCQCGIKRLGRLKI